MTEEQSTEEKFQVLAAKVEVVKKHDTDKYFDTFMSELERSMTDSSYRLSFDKNLLSSEIMELYEDMKRLKSELAKLKENPYSEPAKIEDKEKELKKDLFKTRELWFGHMKDLMKFEDAQVAREMPKKMEVVHATIPASDIHKIMSGDFTDFINVTNNDKDKV